MDKDIKYITYPHKCKDCDAIISDITNTTGLCRLCLFKSTFKNDNNIPVDDPVNPNHGILDYGETTKINNNAKVDVCIACNKELNNTDAAFMNAYGQVYHQYCYDKLFDSNDNVRLTKFYCLMDMHVVNTILNNSYIRAEIIGLGMSSMYIVYVELKSREEIERLKEVLKEFKKGINYIVDDNVFKL